MTGKEFQTWLRGYLEGVRSGDADEIDHADVVERIEKEAEKIDAAPIIDLQKLLRESPKVEPWPSVPWRIEPTAPPWNSVPIVYSDCGCDPNTVCGSTACPRTPWVVC